jgi:hypothetical protein
VEKKTASCEAVFEIWNVEDGPRTLCRGEQRTNTEILNFVQDDDLEFGMMMPLESTGGCLPDDLRIAMLRLVALAFG